MIEMPETLVSVVTICWQDLPGLRRTVDSVRSQSYGPMEHIIVDGGSTDGTAEYLQKLEPQPNWSSRTDKGRYDGMNIGTARANGELIIYMNSGDVFHDSSTVEKIVSRYAKSRFAWAYGLSNIVGPSGTVAVGGRIPFNHARFVIGGHVIPHQATIFSRSIVEAVGQYRIDIGLAADQEYMMRASMIKAPEGIADVLCDFDASGVGSARGAFHHYRDVARARKGLNVSVTGSRYLDLLMSTAFWFGTLVQRKSRALTLRLKPSFRGVSSDD